MHKYIHEDDLHPAVWGLATLLVGLLIPIAGSVLILAIDVLLFAITGSKTFQDLNFKYWIDVPDVWVVRAALAYIALSVCLNLYIRRKRRRAWENEVAALE